MVYNQLPIDLLQLGLQVLELACQSNHFLRRHTLLLLEFFELSVKFDDLLLIVLLASSLIGKLLVTVILELFPSIFISLKSSFNVFQHTHNLFLLLLILLQVCKGILMSLLKLVYSSGLLQHPIDLDLIHQRHLIDLTLLNDVVRAIVSQTQTLQKI